MAAPTKSGSGDSSVLPPPMMWAQRKDKVWITVNLENCKNAKHDLKDQTFHFSGKGGTENLDHAVTLELFGEIDPEKSECRLSDRQAFFTLIKKDQSGFWPRLTKEQKKFHFLKTDFNRWKDEDDTDDEEEKEDFNLDQMMHSMGGLNGGDFGGMGASPDGEEEDSDDEDLPDLQ